MVANYFQRHGSYVGSEVAMVKRHDQKPSDWMLRCVLCAAVAERNGVMCADCRAEVKVRAADWAGV